MYYTVRWNRAQSNLTRCLDSFETEAAHLGMYMWPKTKLQHFRPATTSTSITVWGQQVDGPHSSRTLIVYRAPM